MADQPRIIFGPFELDCHGRSVTRGGTPIALGGRAFDVLAALVGAGGELVSKDALLDQVWARVAVDENNLQAQVSALRKALGDDVIVTVPGRGYRLAAPAHGGSSRPDEGEGCRQAGHRGTAVREHRGRCRATVLRRCDGRRDHHRAVARPLALRHRGEPVPKRPW
jgi:DNA-binding winged helix-turn-helix (wHTH) protein